MYVMASITQQEHLHHQHLLKHSINSANTFHRGKEDRSSTTGRKQLGLDDIQSRQRVRDRNPHTRKAYKVKSEILLYTAAIQCPWKCTVSSGSANHPHSIEASSREYMHGTQTPDSHCWPMHGQQHVRIVAFGIHDTHGYEEMKAPVQPIGHHRMLF